MTWWCSVLWRFSHAITRPACPRFETHFCDSQSLYDLLIHLDSQLVLACLMCQEFKLLSTYFSSYRLEEGTGYSFAERIVAVGKSTITQAKIVFLFLFENYMLRGFRVKKFENFFKDLNSKNVIAAPKLQHVSLHCVQSFVLNYSVWKSYRMLMEWWCFAWGLLL